MSRVASAVNGYAAELYPGAWCAGHHDADNEVNGSRANDQVMRDDDPQAELAEIRRCTAILTETAGTRPVG